MKILINTGLYPPEIGGPATYAVLVEEALKERGHDVYILPFRDVRIYPSVIRHFLYFLKTIRLLRSVDIVLAQDTVSVGLPSVLACKLMNKRIVIRVPGDFAWEQGVQRFGVSEGIDDFQKTKYGFRVELLRSIQKWVVRSADFVITPSDYFLGLVRGWGVKASQSQRIYNGVSIPDGIIPKVFERPTIVSAGRLVPWKGFDILIDVVRNVPVDLIIVGEGEDRTRLESLVLQKGLKDRVQFIGALPRAELLTYISGARVFVLPSSFESFSFQLVEAMMLGCTVVALNAGNLNEIIKSRENGILIEKTEIKNLPIILNTLLNDVELSKRLGVKAKKDSQKFSINTTVSELLNVFKSLV